MPLFVFFQTPKTPKPQNPKTPKPLSVEYIFLWRPSTSNLQPPAGWRTSLHWAGLVPQPCRSLGTRRTAVWWLTSSHWGWWGRNKRDCHHLDSSVRTLRTLVPQILSASWGRGRTLQYVLSPGQCLSAKMTMLGACHQVWVHDHGASWPVMDRLLDEGSTTSERSLVWPRWWQLTQWSCSPRNGEWTWRIQKCLSQRNVNLSSVQQQILKKVMSFLCGIFCMVACYLQVMTLHSC